jgi:hypothetical protein
MSEATRAWIYRVSLALIAVGVIYGVVSEEQAVAWGAVVLAVTGNGLAALNTTTKGD